MGSFIREPNLDNRLITEIVKDMIKLYQEIGNHSFRKLSVENHMLKFIFDNEDVYIGFPWKDQSTYLKIKLDEKFSRTVLAYIFENANKEEILIGQERWEQAYKEVYGKEWIRQ